MFLFTRRRGSTDAGQSESDFYFKSNPSYLPWSLLAANLSVSGGIIAFSQLSLTHGKYALIAPFSTLVGWALFAFVFKKCSAKGKDIIELDPLRNVRNPLFQKVYNWSWVILLIAVAGWELYAASSILAEFAGAVTEVAKSIHSLAVAVVIAAGVFLYMRSSGFSSVTRTDIVQLLMAVLILVVIFFNVCSKHKPTFEISSPPINTGTITWFCISLFIATCVSQIVNPMNWHYANAAKKANYSTVRLIAIPSLFLVSIWAAIFLATHLIESKTPYPDIISSGTTWSRVFVLIGVCGFTSSTVDSLIFAALRRTRVPDTNSPFRIESENRKIAFMLVASVFVAFSMIKFTPTLFASIMGISGSLMVFAPVTVAAALSNGEFKISNDQSIIYVALFLITFSSGVILSFSGLNEAAVIVPFVALVVSSLVTVYVRSKS